jgi:CBS-domain-containing membrane protein
MTRRVITIRDTTPIVDAVRRLDRHRLHGLPVVDRAGWLVGVISQTDILRADLLDGRWSQWPEFEAKHLMTSPAITVASEDELATAVNLMKRHGVHRLVIVDEANHPVGVVSASDLVRVTTHGDA